MKEKKHQVILPSFQVALESHIEMKMPTIGQFMVGRLVGGEEIKFIFRKGMYYECALYDSCM